MQSNACSRIGVGGLFSLLMMAVSGTAADYPSRLDLYDGFDNHLLFVTFGYDESMRCVGRTVYMADGTFMRHVAINYTASGFRASEISYNFNNDTSFVMRNRPGAEATDMTLHDQFGLDFIGGPVVSRRVDPLNYSLSFQRTGGLAAAVSYELDEAGGLQKVFIQGASASDSYYGVFTGGGTGIRPGSTLQQRRRSSRVVVTPRGGATIDLQLTLGSSAEVRCDLVTLSGRDAGTLFYDRIEAGSETRTLRIDGKAGQRVAPGVYLLVVSVDGVRVASTKYLHRMQQVRGGAR